MICSTLISFAKQRERAYKITGNFTGSRAKAVTRIKQVADYWKGKNEECAIRQASQEIREILPAPDSRFAKQRNQILTLLNNHL